MAKERYQPSPEPTGASREALDAFFKRHATSALKAKLDELSLEMATPQDISERIRYQDGKYLQLQEENALTFEWRKYGRKNHHRIHNNRTPTRKFNR